MLATATTPASRYESSRFRTAFASLVTHYWSHGSWLDSDQVFATRDGSPPRLTLARVSVRIPYESDLLEVSL